MASAAEKTVRLFGLIVSAKARLWFCVGVAVLLLILPGIVMLPTILATTTMTSACAIVGSNGSGLTVMTFNLLGAGLGAGKVPKSSRGDLAWARRGPVAAQWVKTHAPAIVGFQENRVDPKTGRRQTATIADALPGYTWVPGIRPAQPIAYQAQLGISVADAGTIQISRAGRYGATSHRYATWARFSSASGTFLFVNVHSQYKQTKAAAKARSRGWVALLSAIAKLNPDKGPVIVVGDLNASIDESRKLYRDHLTKFAAAGFIEAGRNAPRTSSAVTGLASYNGFGAKVKGKFRYKAVKTSGYRIDQVWISRNISPLSAQVSTGPAALERRQVAGRSTYFYPGILPSDHNPFVAQLAIGSLGAASSAADTSAATDTNTVVAGYKGVQLANAQKVVQAADKLGLDDWTAAVGIMTAMGESSLINVDHGDATRADTIGLFQTGPEWGPYPQRMDPYGAALLFYDRLQDVAGYHQLAPTLAAHKAQRNADPYHYAKYWDPAREVLAWVRQNPSLAGLGDGQECNNDGDTIAGPIGACPASGSPAEGGLLSTAVYGLRCTKEAFPWLTSIGGRRDGSSSTCSFSDHCKGLATDFMIAKWSTPAGNGRGWQVAKWVQAHAAELHVTYIIWDAKVWRAHSPGKGWAPYTHPYGNASPTLAHRDHVHVSYAPPG